jgi:hypothetical protein
MIGGICTMKVRGTCGSRPLLKIELSKKTVETK